MDRRAFLGALAGGLLAAPLAVAQPKVPRIGLLIWYAPDPGVQELFRRGFREAGYVEGQNVVFEWRWAERKPARAAELARELVRLNVDVLVVHPTPAIEPAQNATRTIPIVVLAGNPVGTGAAASLARPGGNTTGVSTNAVELAGKRLELLREILPRMRRVGFLAYSATRTARSSWTRPGRPPSGWASRCCPSSCAVLRSSTLRSRPSLRIEPRR